LLSGVQDHSRGCELGLPHWCSPWYFGQRSHKDLPWQLRGSWTSSRLPTSLASPQRLLPYSVTAWTQDTWTALTLCGTNPNVFVRPRSLASAAPAFSMHRLSCSLNVSCASIQMPSRCVGCLLKRVNQYPTCIFIATFGGRCFLWPRLHIHSAASVFAVSNCRPRLFAY
jgi:hypothetical protein